MYIMCLMFVPRFELQGRYITNFHYYYDAKERVQKPSFPTVIVQPIHCYQHPYSFLFFFCFSVLVVFSFSLLTCMYWVIIELSDSQNSALYKYHN